MVLLEAAGYKVPSISFDIQTGPAEIIEDGKTGQKFALDKIVAQWERLLEEII